MASSPPLARLQERYALLENKHASSLDELFSIRGLFTAPLPQHPIEGQESTPKPSSRKKRSGSDTPLRVPYSPPSPSTSPSTPLLASPPSSPSLDDRDTVVLIGEVDDLEQPSRRTGKRRRAATSSSTVNIDKKYIRGVGETVREITDFCTQMDHLDTLPKGASDVSDLHASTLIQQALDGFDSDSGTDSGEEMNDGKILKKLTNRRQGFPSQIHASNERLMPVNKICPSDFLFFFTSKTTNANDYIDFQGRMTHFTTNAINFSNEPFSAFIEPPSKKRKGGSSSSSSSSSSTNSDKLEIDEEKYTAKERAEMTFLNGLPRNGAERASYYADLVPHECVYEESVHKVINSFVVVNPNSGGEEGDDEDEGEEDKDKGKGPKKKKKRKREIKKVQTLKWTFMLKKDVTKMAKQMSSFLVAKMNFCKKVAALCEKEVQRRNKEASRLHTKEAAARAKRISREVAQYWRKFEKEQRDAKKIAEKMELERIKREEEVREAKRQQKKLNFLLTQTELFSHFISRKIQTDSPALETQKMIVVPQGEAATNEEIEENVQLQEAAKRKAELAHEKHVQEMSNFDERFEEQRQTNLDQMNQTTNQTTNQTATPKKKDIGKGDVAIHGSFDVSELEADALKIQTPKLFQGKLREYQLRGLRWLVNVYNNGINGILADEMGLGKTIQSMSLLAHLAEEKGIWGPFLVVCPKSTLPNWQQEFQKFIPQFKVLPYWGSQNERKVLRSFWNPKRLYTPEASCHVLITSYGFAVKDVKHLQKIKWQYMVLDEAQALKSSQSQRWKTLLSYNARNRLLLTGTPIQNNMAELWALLHFIMPTIFDSHDEFNEWFSKDIESHAENQSGSLSDHQLSRLHTILKPFMLRRVKGDVENELAPKTEIDLYCELSARQRRFYQFVRRNVSIAEIGLLKSSMEKGRGRPSEVQMKRLMNLVMQFRKVCNHPDIFERNDVTSPFSFANLKVESGNKWDSPLALTVPRLIYQDSLVYGHKLGCSKGCSGSMRSSLTGLEAPLSTFLVDRALRLKFNIFAPDYMAERLRGKGEGEGETSMITSPASFQSSSFSFLRFSGMSIGEVDEMVSSPYLAWFRWLNARSQRQRKNLVYGSPSERGPNFLEIEPKNSLFLLAEQKMSTLIEFFGDSHSEGRAPLIQTGERKMTDLRGDLQLYGEVYVPRVIAPPIPLFCSLYGNVTQRQYSSRGPLCRTAMFGVCAVPEIPYEEENNDPTLESNGISMAEGGDAGGKAKVAAATPTRGSSRLSRRGKAEEKAEVSEPATPRVLNSLLVKNQEDWHSVSFGVRRAMLPGESEKERWLEVETGDQFGEVDKLRKAVGEERGGEGMTSLFEKRSYMTVPSMEKLIRDCGKLKLLDSLLVDLKAGGHRVLVYSQMTKMLTILEDYMQYRKYSYVRLDGSTSLEERALMVNNFQKDTSIYVFLLSTRAGGLGINLTAADTVIFYDSDWNPTIDAQAMDRAHRLGQTRPVTVYRLISKGTVEERILQRAKQKNTIQNIVIAGGVGRQDMDDASSGDPGASEVMSLLLGDDELEEQLKKQQSERSHKRKRGGGGQGGVSKKVKSFF